jgi:hypothetical protein
LKEGTGNQWRREPLYPRNIKRSKAVPEEGGDAESSGFKRLFMKKHRRATMKARAFPQFRFPVDFPGKWM